MAGAVDIILVIQLRHIIQLYSNQSHSRRYCTTGGSQGGILNQCFVITCVDGVRECSSTNGFLTTPSTQNNDLICWRVLHLDALLNRVREHLI